MYLPREAFRRFSQLAPAVAGVVLCGAAFAQSASPRPAMAPHRALYELSLLKTSGEASASVGASGRIAYDFSGSACEGYTTNFRQATEMTSPEGESISTQMRSTSFESADHGTLNFRVETGSARGAPEITEGMASRSGDGSLSIALRRPTIMKADTDHDALFPTDMMIRAIEAARAGQVTYSTKLYDGTSEGQKVYYTLSVIGRPTSEALGDPTKDAPAMRDMRRWPVKVSYFDVAKADSPPVYLMSFQMWENGISSDLVLDYGSFQLKGELTKLEMLPKGNCGK
jgi:hypothetical protein